MNTEHRIKIEILSWLLEPDNPAVRYWTLRDILNKSDDDPEVAEARTRISTLPQVEELFNLQFPQGHWGEDPTKPYTAKGALGVLGLLHVLGCPPDERTAAGCDSFLLYAQNANGGFSMVKTRLSGIFPCTTGEHLPFLIYFGFENDERVQRAFTYLISEMKDEDALSCGRYQHQPCLWGAIATLRGLSVLPENMRSAESDQVIDALANVLLSFEYDFEGEHKRWLTFGVPRAWDLLSALSVLAAHGFVNDPRLKPLLSLLLRQQNRDGYWICGSSSRTYPLEKRNHPSKWVTLDVLRLLKASGSQLV